MAMAGDYVMTIEVALSGTTIQVQSQVVAICMGLNAMHLTYTHEVNEGSLDVRLEGE